jgi:O-antigen/teichoic acid export membrane protein
MSSASHRQIFKSTLITGGATAVTLVAGLVKVKALAVLGGPVAIGLMGIYQSIVSTAATVAGCGLPNSAVRALAAQGTDGARTAGLWRAMLVATLLLGLGATVLLTLGAGLVGQWLMHAPFSVAQALVLSVGVATAMLFAMQTALLQGLRRIGDLALVSIASAVLGAVISLLPVLLDWPHAIIWFVVMSPLCSAALTAAGLHFKRIVPARSGDAPPMGPLLGPMFKLGLPIMAANLAMMGAQLAARGVVFGSLGADAAGQFQAAWAISTTYGTFVLSAMAADYFPRLSTLYAQSEAEAASRLVNQQADMTQTLSGPLLLALIAFSPLAVTLLYSREFGPATELLRWLALGDVLKVLGWPIRYILLAAGKGRLFIVGEVVWGASYLAALYFLLADHGLVIAGIGYVAAYLVQLAFFLAAGRVLIGLRISRRNLLSAVALLALGAAMIATRSLTYAGPCHGVAILLVAVYAVHRLDRMIDIRDILRKRRARP